MKRVICPLVKFKAIVQYPLTCKTLKRSAEGDPVLVQANHGLIAPHCLVSCLWETRRASFYKRILGERVKCDADIRCCLESFWSAVPASDPRLDHLVRAYIRAGARSLLSLVKGILAFVQAICNVACNAHFTYFIWTSMHLQVHTHIDTVIFQESKQAIALERLRGG